MLMNGQYQKQLPTGNWVNGELGEDHHGQRRRSQQLGEDRSMFVSGDGESFQENAELSMRDVRHDE
jgi:hypothetical protein